MIDFGALLDPKKGGSKDPSLWGSKRGHKTDPFMDPKRGVNLTSFLGVKN